MLVEESNTQNNTQTFSDKFNCLASSTSSSSSEYRSANELWTFLSMYTTILSLLYLVNDFSPHRFSIFPSTWAAWVSFHTRLRRLLLFANNKNLRSGSSVCLHDERYSSPLSTTSTSGSGSSRRRWGERETDGMEIEGDEKIKLLLWFSSAINSDKP